MNDPDSSLPRGVSLIGCCGACCGTCPALADHSCKGCKLGYEDGSRDIQAARCAMKRCCMMEKKIATCAECKDYTTCGIIRDFFAKKGYKYKKYRESLEFIRAYGYPAFIAATQTWKRAYGTLK